MGVTSSTLRRRLGAPKPSGIELQDDDQTSIGELTSRLQQIGEERESLVHELESARSWLSHLDQANADLMEALEASNRRVRKLDLELCDQGPVLELQARLERCQDDLARSESDIMNLNAMRKHEIQAYKDMLQQYSDEDAPEKLEKAIADIADMDSKYALLQAEKKNMESAFQRKESEYLALKTNIDGFEARMKAIQSSLDDSNRTVENQQKELASTQHELQMLHAERMEEQTTISNLREQVQELENERKDNVVENLPSDPSVKYGSLAEEVGCLKKKIRQKEELIRRKTKSHSRVVSRLSNAIVLADWKQAVEEVQTEASDDFQKDRLEDAWKALKAHATVLARFSRLSEQMEARTQETEQSIEQTRTEMELEEQKRLASDAQRGIASEPLMNVESIDEDFMTSASSSGLRQHCFSQNTPSYKRALSRYQTLSEFLPEDLNSFDPEERKSMIDKKYPESIAEESCSKEIMRSKNGAQDSQLSKLDDMESSNELLSAVEPFSQEKP